MKISIETDENFDRNEWKDHYKRTKRLKEKDEKTNRNRLRY